LFHHLDGASAAEFVGMFRYVTTEAEDSSYVFVRTVALPVEGGKKMSIFGLNQGSEQG
jgi:hypothetical protein